MDLTTIGLAENMDVEPYIEMAIFYGTQFITAAIIFIIGKWIARRLANLLKKGMTKGGVDITLVNFLGNLVYYLIFAFVIIAALSQLGIQTASMAAVIAAAGLAVGLALQGSLSNFAAGVMLILFRPFKAGDYIEAAGIAGTVEAITIFTTTLKTPDNKIIIAPNSKVSGDNITNYSANSTRRLDLVIGVGYDDDLAKVKSTLQKILDEESRLLKDHAPVIGVLEFGDSSVNFAVRPWVKTTEFWPVRFDLMEKIKVTFDENDITIPYPQRDLHIIDGNVAVTKTEGVKAK